MSMSKEMQKKDKFAESFGKTTRRNTSNNNNNNSQYSDFKKNTNTKMSPSINIKDTNQFPELSSVNNNIIESQNYENTYNNVVSTNNIEPVNSYKNEPTAGWIIIKKNTSTRDIETEYIPSEIIKNNNIINIDYDSPHYIMSKIAELTVSNREYYRREYDQIHGRGAFNELHYMQPIYSIDENQ